MPVPTSSQLKPIVDGLFKTKGFDGERIDELSEIIAEAMAQSLNLFIVQVKVAPGIPTSTGATVGPGNLM